MHDMTFCLQIFRRPGCHKFPNIFCELSPVTEDQVHGCFLLASGTNLFGKFMYFEILHRTRHGTLMTLIPIRHCLGSIRGQWVLKIKSTPSMCNKDTFSPSTAEFQQQDHQLKPMVDWKVPEIAPAVTESVQCLGADIHGNTITQQSETKDWKNWTNLFKGCNMESGSFLSNLRAP